MTIATSLHMFTGRARWYGRIAWNWLRFRRGTRPRRAVRRWVLATAHYVLARPRLKRPAHAIVRQAPPVEQHLRLLLRPAQVSGHFGSRRHEVHELLVEALKRQAANHP